MICLLCELPLSHAQRYIPERLHCRCDTCGLICATDFKRLNFEQERSRYELHQNSPADSSYRAFLNRLILPMLRYLDESSDGLDFGCGKGPTLSVMMAEKGISMSNYDPHFFPDRSLLAATYDFVTCTEVVEHFKDPQAEFKLLHKILRPGGVLGVMTQFYPEEALENWWYLKDPTHVIFFSPKTFHWIAQHFQFEVLHVGGNIALLKKS